MLLHLGWDLPFCYQKHHLKHLALRLGQKDSFPKPWALEGPVLALLWLKPEEQKTKGCPQQWQYLPLLDHTLSIWYSIMSPWPGVSFQDLCKPTPSVLPPESRPSHQFAYSHVQGVLKGLLLKGVYRSKAFTMKTWAGTGKGLETTLPVPPHSGRKLQSVQE